MLIVGLSLKGIGETRRMLAGIKPAVAEIAGVFAQNSKQLFAPLTVEVGQEAATSLNSKILAKLRENNGSLPVSDKSDPTVITSMFGVSKGNFKKAIGALYKNGQIVIHADRIELS